MFFPVFPWSFCNEGTSIHEFHAKPVFMEPVEKKSIPSTQLMILFGRARGRAQQDAMILKNPTDLNFTKVTQELACVFFAHQRVRFAHCGCNVRKHVNNYTSRDPKQLRTDGQAQTCQQVVAFCASTRMNPNDAVVNPARVALLHVCCWRASRFSAAQELRLGKRVR